MVWGCFSVQEREGVPVLPAPEDDDEWGQIHGSPSGQAVPLHEVSWLQPLPPGRGPVPQIKEGDGIAQPAGVSGHGLARKLTRPESNRECVG